MPDSPHTPFPVQQLITGSNVIGMFVPLQGEKACYADKASLQLYGNCGSSATLLPRLLGCGLCQVFFLRGRKNQRAPKGASYVCIGR